MMPTRSFSTSIFTDHRPFLRTHIVMMMTHDMDVKFNFSIYHDILQSQCIFCIYIYFLLFVKIHLLAVQLKSYTIKR